MDWVKEATAHMKKGRPSKYWTKDRVLESAKGFTSIKCWGASEPSAPVIARRNGWMDEIRLIISVNSKSITTS